MKTVVFFSLVFLLSSCAEMPNEEKLKVSDPVEKHPKSTYELIVLGAAQDAGYPQIACSKICCELQRSGKSEAEFPTSLAVVNRKDKSYWIFEATPKISQQIRLVNDLLENKKQQLPRGIFLSHAHIGHYTGLMHFGREALGADRQKVYAMPRMIHFLQQNGPWKQLVDLENIALDTLEEKTMLQLTKDLSVTPLLVPHRDEYSETVGFLLEVNQHKVLFIPDIDKWTKWNTDIDALIQHVDLAFLDGTFFNADELPGRNMDEIPHPFIEESMALFASLKASDKKKIHFIHFNHTNPILWDNNVRNKIESSGYRVAKRAQRFTL